MKIKDLKKLEHVNVSVNENGMAKVTLDEGWCLQTSVMQEALPDPTEVQSMEATEGAEPEMVEVMSYAKEIYCRKDSVLPEYVVVEDSVLNTEEIN
jgi:hypothetical protein